MAVAAPTSQIIFSCRLLQQLLQRTEENVFVSPASAGLALGMAAAGAQGKTLAALEHTLGVDRELAANRAKRLFASLDTLPPGVVVELANSLWARSGLPLSARYIAAMRESYRAEVRNVGFALPGTTTLVNDWVARATHGHIGSVIDQIDADSILVLVNATYFHGLWSDPFDATSTVDHEFTTGSGGVTEVRLMQKSASFSYMEDADVQAVRLPYKQGRFSLLVVLPRKPLSPVAFQDIAAPSSLTRMLSGLKTRPGTLRLPKVRLAYAADLKAELWQMGMGPAYAEDADFRGVFDRDIPAMISTVFHKSRLEIDEKGTTAAASTFIGVSLGASIERRPPTPFEMTVDRPFLLTLTESETDLILFLGVIGDPTPPSSR
jgi:serine protease inhibitor